MTSGGCPRTNPRNSDMMKIEPNSPSPSTKLNTHPAANAILPNRFRSTKGCAAVRQRRMPSPPLAMQIAAAVSTKLPRQ